MSAGALQPLRESIAAVDRELLDLLRRRMDLAAEVGRVKAAENVPVVAQDVEDRVLARARGHAEHCGISPEALQSIFKAIIQGSVERQHRVGVDSRSKRGGQVLVLGSAGGMGGWFRRFLVLVGHQVAGVDPAGGGEPDAEEWRNLAAVPDLDRFDAILVAVPLADTPAVLMELAQARPRGLVVEVASIKAHLEPALNVLAAAAVRTASLHPMFGPGKSPYEALTFVLACRREAREELQDLEPLLQHPYSRITPMEFGHHDRLMGWLLGLSHLNGILFGTALTRSGLDPAELKAVASTTFERQADTANSVLGEDPDLYLDIQHLNPHRDEVYDATRAALEELVQLIADRDAVGFARVVEAARRTVDP